MIQLIEQITALVIDRGDLQWIFRHHFNGQSPLLVEENYIILLQLAIKLTANGDADCYPVINSVALLL